MEEHPFALASLEILALAVQDSPQMQNSKKLMRQDFDAHLQTTILERFALFRACGITQTRPPTPHHSTSFIPTPTVAPSFVPIPHPHTFRSGTFGCTVMTALIKSCTTFGPVFSPIALISSSCFCVSLSACSSAALLPEVCYTTQVHV